MWHDVGHTLNLNLSWDKRGIRAKNSPISWFDLGIEESEGFFLRSTEFRWLVFVGLRTKVHRIDEGYTWVSEKRDFFEDIRAGISGNQSCQV